MKIRSDYVSNSSSSSFIIDFEDKGACIDNGFIKLLKHINEIILSCMLESKDELKEFEEKAVLAFGPKVDVWKYDDDLDFRVSIDSKYISEDDKQIDYIKDVLQKKNGSIYCQCGDDWGEDFTNAVQVATILEMKYKQIHISGEDHFDYNSIRGINFDV